MDISDLVKDHRYVVIEQMPQNVRDLLYEIEDFSRVKVEFRDTELLKMAAAQYNVNTLRTDVEALYADHERAYLSLPTLNKLDSNAILHELLHLHRYWVEAIPQLEAKTDLGRNVEIAAELDNELEHLIIVPKERNYGFDPEPYWSSRSQQYWAEFPWEKLSPSIRREFTLKGWLHSPLISSELRNDIETRLREADLYSEAERFLQRIREFSGSKPRAVSTALRFLKIPHDEAQLVTMDIRNKKRIVSKIPPH